MTIKGYRVPIYPNNKQNTRLFQIAGATRYIYNWALEYAMNYYDENKKFISDNDLTKELTKFKKIKENNWLYTIPNSSLKQSVKNAANAVKDTYINNKNNHTNHEVHFKAKYFMDATIYLDSCATQFDNNYIKLEKITLSKRTNRQRLNWIRMDKKHKIPPNLKSYYNPTIKYIHEQWYLCIGVEVDDEETITPKESVATEGIGIDLGVKDLAICSNGDVYANINKTNKKIRKCEKRYKHMQRRFSKKSEKHLVKGEDGKKHVEYSNNMTKLRKKMRRLQAHITNIHNDYIHKTVDNIIKKNPEFIAMEDLNIRGMMKNKYLAKAVQNQKLYMFTSTLQYKCEWNGIKFVKIDRWYPSSKKCSCCGNIYKDLKLKDRVYNCKVCNLSIDRDYNASINIKEEGKRLLTLT